MFVEHNMYEYAHDFYMVQYVLVLCLCRLAMFLRRYEGWMGFIYPKGVLEEGVMVMNGPPEQSYKSYKSKVSTVISLFSTGSGVVTIKGDGYIWLLFCARWM